MDLMAALGNFIRVAETGSFSIAARECGCSQSTVSRSISLLEDHFQARLLNRTTRSLTITEDGHTLLAHARQMSDILDAAGSELGQGRATPQGLVRVGAPTAFGLFLTERLAPLLSQYPGLSVDLVLRDTFGDMIEEGLDISVQVGQLSETTLVARRIADLRRVLVASPNYLERNTSPLVEPGDLHNHSCVAYAYGGERSTWHFARLGIKQQIHPVGQFRANNSEAARRAALVGIGIALLPSYQVEADLRDGRLLHVLPDWPSVELPMHALFPGRRNLPLRTRTVLDFIVEQRRPTHSEIDTAHDDDIAGTAA